MGWSQRLSAPPRLVHLTTSLDTGGAQAMLAKLVELSAGKPRWPDHTIVSLIRPGPVAARLQTSGCTVYDLGMKRGLPTPAAMIRLLRIVGSLSPDLVQGWMYHGNLAATLAGQVVRKPVVWNVRHSLNALDCESRTTRLLLRLSARLSHRTSAIVYNSKAAAAQHEALGFDAGRTIVIPNGFDCTAYHPERSRKSDVRSLFGIPEGPTLVCMAARLHPMKDHANLVEAIGIARQAGHDLHLLLVGPGLDRAPPSLVEAIRRFIPSDRVTLAGERNDLSNWLGGVDIVALSSAWGEAYPNILGEAMACGVPCAATAVGDCQAIVDDAGIVVPPRQPEALARALVTLAALGTQGRAQMGARGRARVSRDFALEGIGYQYRRLYERLLSEPAAAFEPPPLLTPDKAHSL